MITQAYPTLEAPKAVQKNTQASPRFYGELSVGPEIKALMGHLDMSPLNQRAIVAYGIEEEELKDVLLESMTSELHSTYLLKTPQRLAKEFHVVPTESGWAVVDGLGMIKADSMETKLIAEGMCALFDTHRDAITEFPMNENPTLPEQQ